MSHTYSFRIGNGSRPHQQTGVSLVVVLVLTLLSSLLVLGSTRVGLMNETVMANDLDYARTFEAAQILLRDGELDLQNVRNTAGGLNNKRSELLSFSKKDSDLIQNLTAAAISAGTTLPCTQGVCAHLGDATSGDPTVSFWNNPSTGIKLTAMRAVGATYGEYTGAATVTTSTSNGMGYADLNPIIKAGQAWYWIEVLPYSGQSAPWARGCAPSPGSPQYVYRITAVAVGRGTDLSASPPVYGPATVVQQVMVPNPTDENRRCP